MRAACLAVALWTCALSAQAEDRCKFEPPAITSALAALPANARIGVALGSGSMHGYAHIGVLRELEARGVPVHVVAGTSVGALVGGLWASGLSASQIEVLAEREGFEDMVRVSGSWQGLFNSDPMRKPLEAAFRGRAIESWPRRFGAVATNLADGHRRIIATGDAATAIQASSAVPVFYMPVTVNGERLGDGALVEPVPVDAARDLGANIVIAVDVAYRPVEGEASGLTGYAFQAMHILVNSLAASQARTADVVIHPNLHKRWMECGREGLVAAGRDAVAQAWPEIARALSPERVGLR